MILLICNIIVTTKESKQLAVANYKSLAKLGVI